MTEMTGRDLILYILENNLENELVIKDGKFVGLMTVEEAAVKMKVGPATICAWVQTKHLPSVRLGDAIYIPANAKAPRVAHIHATT